MSRHPAENYLKYLLIQDPQRSDDDLTRHLTEMGFLSAQEETFPWLRVSIPDQPADFDPGNKLHRPSMQYLRDQQVYEMFWPNEGMREAYEILGDPTKRLAVEQVLLARLELKATAQKLNRKMGWFLTAAGMEAYRHYFWNVKLLTFDEWGRFLYGRNAMYEKYMGLLQGPKELAFFHLRLEQTLETKTMIKRAAEIAYFTLEEVAQKPGAGPDKVKAVSMLSKTLIECHGAMSTSDMALKEVLRQFERFRMEHNQPIPKDIKVLAPKGNYTRSGVVAEKEKVPT